MKFGKLADISQVDFKLPTPLSGTTAVLSKGSAREGKGQAYIGCTGWSMPQWVGKVYPKGTKSKDYLHHYSRQFNTIEFNTTHYRIPDVTTIEKWRRESSDDFKFCPKIPQSISHSRNLGLGEAQIMMFCNAIQGLEEKLGCCFMQLPPYFGFDRLGLLDRFLKGFPNHIPLAVEFRHESWFNQTEHTERLWTLLEKHKTATVITDVAGRRDVLHMRLTMPVAMVRFVGNALDSSDYSRIDEWADRVSQWFQQGLHELYFFTHEPDNVLAPELAAYLVDKMKTYPEINVRGPKFLDDTAGQQMSLF
ncbi:MAG: hypothetical protein DHS20C18_43130 [Saprospiraceae bacterium]|nr:MAG: hypothetical protein DHS20C18_43130 [Saprospiraceae bacterium]